MQVGKKIANHGTILLSKLFFHSIHTFQYLEGVCHFYLCFTVYFIFTCQSLLFYFFNIFLVFSSYRTVFAFSFFFVERKFLQEANINVSCCCFQLHLLLKGVSKGLAAF